MNTLEVLRGMRELLSDPARWTKQVHARDANGREVPPKHSEAVCWCLDGAMLKVSGHEGFGMVGEAAEQYFAAQRIVRSIARDNGLMRGDMAYSDWNDLKDTQHEDVLGLLDRAIAAEEAKGSGT